MIEERIKRFQELSNNRYYKRFNLVLEELVERVVYKKRWGQQHANDVASFFL